MVNANVASVVLLGSVTRKEETAQSDYDLWGR